MNINVVQVIVVLAAWRSKKGKVSYADAPCLYSTRWDSTVLLSGGEWFRNRIINYSNPTHLSYQTIREIVFLTIYLHALHHWQRSYGLMLCEQFQHAHRYLQTRHYVPHYIRGTNGRETNFITFTFACNAFATKIRHVFSNHVQEFSQCVRP